MKNLLTALLMVLIGTIIITSCTKTDLNDPGATSQSLNSPNVNPNVPECGIGYHWDYYLNKCVPNCSSGYHNDSITGACVVDAGGAPSPITVVTNPNNPVEIVGSDHNSGMTNIIPNNDYGQLLPTEENVLAM